MLRVIISKDSWNYSAQVVGELRYIVTELVI